MIDWTVNVGVLVQIVVIVVAVVTFVVAVKGDVLAVKENISDIKEELKELRKVLTTQVNHEGRIERLEQDVRELRHGEGFVLPIGGVRNRTGS